MRYPGSAVSAITRAAEMCAHFTGMPSAGSLEPHRPGPIRIYPVSASTYDLLSFSISRATIGLLNEEKFCVLTYTTSVTPSIMPCPRALDVFIISWLSDVCMIFSSSISLRSTIGRICNQYTLPFVSPCLSMHPANSISTGRRISFSPSESMKSTISASGNALCCSTLANVTTRRPLPYSLSRITWS